MNPPTRTNVVIGWLIVLGLLLVVCIVAAVVLSPSIFGVASLILLCAFFAMIQ
jgi:hypothetical protein